MTAFECPNCDGIGNNEGIEGDCPTCEGTGVVCPECEGRKTHTKWGLGKDGLLFPEEVEPCQGCGGSGQAPEEIPIAVEVEVRD